MDTPRTALRWHSIALAHTFSPFLTRVFSGRPFVLVIVLLSFTLLYYTLHYLLYFLEFLSVLPSNLLSRSPNFLTYPLLHYFRLLFFTRAWVGPG